MKRKKEEVSNEEPIVEATTEATEEVTAEAEVSNEVSKPKKGSLPDDIRKLLEDLRDKGVAYVGAHNLRLLEPYGWNGTTTGAELAAWADERLSA